MSMKTLFTQLNISAGSASRARRNRCLWWQQKAQGVQWLRIRSSGPHCGRHASLTSTSGHCSGGPHWGTGFLHRPISVRDKRHRRDGFWSVYFTFIQFFLFYKVAISFIISLFFESEWMNQWNNATQSHRGGYHCFMHSSLAPTASWVYMTQRRHNIKIPANIFNSFFFLNEI